MPEIRFSSVHGQNLQLENNGNIAAWKLNKHGGCCVTNRPLAKGDKLKIILEGSGHVLMGFLGSRPNLASVMIESVDSLDQNAHWVQMRLKKERTSVTLHRKKSNEILYIRSDGRSPEKKIATGKEAFLCFEVVFGNIFVELDCSGGVKKPIIFDKECGFNVELVHQESRARLKNINPSATCCTNRPLHSDETVDLVVRAKDDANWTFIKLFISNGNADETKIQDLQTRNGVNSNLLFPRDGIKIDKKGSIQFCLTKRGEMSYAVDTVPGQVAIDRSIVDPSKPVYLYMELFRSRVEMRSTIQKKEDHPYMLILERDEGYLTPINDKIPKTQQLDLAVGFPERSQCRSCSGMEYLAMEINTHQTTPKSIDLETVSKKSFSESDSQDSETMLKRVVDKSEQQGSNSKSSFQGTAIVESDDLLTKVEHLPVEPNEPRGNGANWDDCMGGEGSDPTGSLVVKTNGSLTKQKNLKEKPEEIGGRNLSTGNDEGGQGSVIKLTPPRPPRPQESAGACGPLPLPPRVLTFGGTSAPMYVNEPEPPRIETAFQKKIRINYTKLLDRLEPQHLADLLFEKHNIAQEELDQINEKQLRKDKCRKVLGILLRKPGSEGTFKEALKGSSQTDILTMLHLD